MATVNTNYSIKALLVSALYLFPLVFLLYSYSSGHHEPSINSDIDYTGSCDISNLPSFKHSEVCRYIQNNCDPIIFKISETYYCSHESSSFQIYLLIIIAISIILCFSIFGLITSNYLYPNLDTLSSHLRMSRRISGLTLLALGNATPDIFSTYSAMSSNSSGLAIGELIGSANFVICFIIGAMGIIKPFKVNFKEFLKDIGFFAMLILLSFYFIYDEKLKNIECILMVFSYFAYVIYSIMFTNEGKELEERDDLSILVDDEENQLLSPTFSHQSPSSPLSVKSVRSIRSVMSNTSIVDDDNKIRGLQKLSIFDSMKVWRSKSDEHLDIAFGESDSYFQHHHKQREHQPLLSPNFLPTKSYSANDINRLHIPKLTVDTQIPESDERPHIIQQPIPVHATPPIPAIIIEQSPSPISAHTSLPIISSSLYSKVQYVIYPLTKEDFNSIITIATTPLIVVFNIFHPAYPIHLLEQTAMTTYAKELNYRNTIFKYQILVNSFIFHQFLFPRFPITLLVPLSLFAFFILHHVTPFYKYLIPLSGFITSILVIITTSSHLITILKNIGVISHISEGLLGLTILSLGNSTGDLISNLTLARLDLSVIGLNACFGSPLLYVLFGIGINGLILNLKSGVDQMVLEINDSFKICGFGLVVMICFYLIVVPLNNWRIDRKVGLVGVCWWCLITCANVYFEVNQ